MSMFIDIKYAVRLLFQSPKFTAMTIGVLIGGLSISLFTFSFLYSTIYKPLPIPEGTTAKSVTVYHNERFRHITGYEFENVKNDLSSFDEFGIYENANIRVSVEQSGKNYSGSYIRPGFLEFSRVLPIQGRVIQDSDLLEGAKPVALISYELWQADHQGSNDILEKTMVINGQITEIIGVMPKAYRFPHSSQIWLPLTNEYFNDDPEKSTSYFAYARLKQGVEIAQAEQELGQAINQIYQENVKLYGLPELNKTVQLMTFQMAQTGNDGNIVFAFLMLISWLILLLACINVGNLLFARTIERQKETAIRAALGAKTKRLVSQLMWEGTLITCLGALLSVLLVAAVLDYTEVVLSSWLPNGGAFWWHYGMDSETLAMAILFTLVTILLSTFLPAWRSANQDINLVLRDGTRGAQSKKSGRFSRILVTTQVFLVAVLMLIGSISAFIAHKFINMEMGDNYQDVMTARFTIPELKYTDQPQQLALLSELIERLKSHPQVVDVITHNWMGSSAISLDGHEYQSEEEKPKVDTISVIGDSATVGISLKAGRQFTHNDKLGQQKVAIISQSMANRYWPGESPLEKSLLITVNDKDEKVVIVGVVSNRMNASKMFGKRDSADEIYLSGLQFSDASQILFYRVHPDTKDRGEIFYQAMFQTDRNIELDYEVQPSDKNRNMMRDSMRLMSNITFGTGFFALLLAMVGIYGLTANAVAQRTHEVGIRRAVGASDKSIIQMFLKQGAKQLLIGLGLAMVLFYLLAFGFHKFTEGIFPITIYFMQAVVVAVGLSLVVMFATYLPTRRAVKMEPSLALRYE
ncbi:FtsX-like permease family protein [Thalassotalea castellviae]|uniref:FtsX-like permease family protein n=1 Tax=Thalassotalea castellviae TaxID=3075612 RepID=A0ABU3A4G9_9GAMM|nr:FtsX-like permease family protein [Thalassotalea sp. W431]MDT0605081.1 FtsX-like permease family protein [Thalassotalea sp. W431]